MFISKYELEELQDRVARLNNAYYTNFQLHQDNTRLRAELTEILKYLQLTVEPIQAHYRLIPIPKKKKE